MNNTYHKGHYRTRFTALGFGCSAVLSSGSPWIQESDLGICKVAGVA